MHKDIYTIGHTLTKRDKLGIHQDIEIYSRKLQFCLIEAAFTRKQEKQKVLEAGRIVIEILKNILRTEHELGIINERTYLRIAKDLVEISKMLNGWLAYTSK